MAKWARDERVPSPTTGCTLLWWCCGHRIDWGRVVHADCAVPAGLRHAAESHCLGVGGRGAAFDGTQCHAYIHTMANGCPLACGSGGCCALTNGGGQPVHGLQLQSLWRIPTAAVSGGCCALTNGGGQPVHGLQLQSLWRIPTAAVSGGCCALTNGGGQPVHGGAVGLCQCDREGKS